MKSSRPFATFTAAVVFAFVAGSGSARAQTLQWDTDTTTNGAQGAVNGKRGWGAGSTWWNGAVDMGWISGADAIFGAVPGEVTDAHVTVDDITFSVSGYTITNGVNFGFLTLGGGTGSHVINAIGSGIISVQLDGTQGFDKEGVGELTIRADGPLTGTINVNAGTLTTGDGGNNGLLLNLANVAGAKLNIVSNGQFIIGALSGGGNAGGEVSFSGSLVAGGDNTNRTYAGLLTGSGAFTKTGSGVLTLTNANSSLSGAITIDGGTISVPSVANSAFNSPLGSGSAITIRNSSTLAYTGNGNQNMNRTITLDGTAGGRISVSIPVGNAGLSLSGVINETNGAAPLRVSSTGIGFLRLNGANAFTGGLFIDEGNIVVNGVADSGTNSPLGRSGAVTLGSGGNLNGGFFYEGAANDSTNRPIKIDRLGTIGVSTAGTVLTLSGVISNDDTQTASPIFTKAGPGILVLSAIETYDDPDLAAIPGPDSVTIILDGTLRVPASFRLPVHTRVDVRSGATFDTASSGETIGSLTGAGSVIANSILDTGGDDSAAVTFSGAISGAGSLRKAGVGTQTLSGTNTYAGVTAINAGTLAVSGGSAIPDASSVQVAGGATFLLNASESVGGLSGAGTVSFAIDTTLFTGLDNASTLFSGRLTGANPAALTKLGTGTLTLTNSASDAINLVISISGGGAISVPDVRDSGVTSPLGSSGPLDLGGATVPEGTGTLILTGALAHSTNRGFTLNPGGGIIDVPSSNTTLTISGAISGTGSLTKAGLGTLVLTNAANNFTGGVLIRDGGILRVADVANTGAASPLGTSGTISIGNASTSGTFQFSGTGPDQTNRVVLLGAGGGVISISDSGGALAITSAVGGAGSLTKRGSGAFILSSIANSFAGPVNIDLSRIEVPRLDSAGDSGPLGIGDRINLGTATTLGELTLVATTLFESTNRQIDVAAGGGRLSINNGAGTTTTFIHSGQVTGAGPLTYAADENTDKFRLSAMNTRTGPTFISSATVEIEAGSGLPDNGLVELLDGTAAVLAINVIEGIGSLKGGAGATPGRVLLNAELCLGFDDSSTTFSGVIEGPGRLAKHGTGAFTLANANTFSGELQVGRGSLIAASPSGAAISTNVFLGFGIDPVFLILGAANQFAPGVLLSFANGNQDAKLELRGFSQTLAGLDAPPSQTLSIIQNQEALNSVGSATLTIGDSSNHSFTGLIRSQGSTAGNAVNLVKNGTGTQEIRNIAAQGDNFGTATINAGTLTFNLSTLAGGVANHNKLQNVNVLVNPGGTLGLDGTWTMDRPISGAGDVLKTGAGTVTLSGDNSFTGGITIADGAISVASVADTGANSPLGAGGAITLGDATHTGRLAFSFPSSFVPTDRPFVLGAGGGAIDVTAAGGTLVVSGSIGGTGTLTKIGPGVLLLEGAKSYTGATNINAGTVTVFGSISGSTTTVSAGGTLQSFTDSSTTATIGPLVLDGGTLQPNLPGFINRLNAASLALNSGAIQFDLGSAILPSGYDNLNVTGGVTLNGPIALTISLAFDPQDGVDVLRLIINDGADPTVLNGPGTGFTLDGNLLTESSLFSVPIPGGTSQLFEIRYGLTAADNDVRLIAVPEPGAFALLLGAAAIAALRQRGRSRRTRH